MTAAIEHTPTARGASLEDVVALIGTLESLAEAKRAALAEIDEQDSRDFLSTDEAMLAARRAKRAAIETELRQVENRLRGAERQRTHLEQVAVCRSVLTTQREVDAKIDRAIEIAKEVDRHAYLAAKGIRELLGLGRGILSALRTSRGRSTLTSEGHTPTGDIASLQDTEMYQFWLQRHLAGEVPGYRTETGPGPGFADACVGHMGHVRTAIEHLLGPDNFPAEVVAEASISTIQER